MNDYRTKTQAKDLREVKERIDTWIIRTFESIVAMFSSDRSATSASIDHGSDRGRTADVGESTTDTAPYPGKRSIGGYVASGMRKMDIARRATAMQKRHASILSAIKETRRALRKVPRDQRYMFDGYGSFLDDLARRESMLYKHLGQADAHLRRYDPLELREEIAGLERYLQTSLDTSPNHALAESSLKARRDLLKTIEGFELRHTTISAQLGHIAATLDLNLVRIVAIVNRTPASATSDADYFNTRMAEISEQLELLEESIQELDRW
jgi:hypothetical protein